MCRWTTCGVIRTCKLGEGTLQTWHLNLSEVGTLVGAIGTYPRVAVRLALGFGGGGRGKK